MARTISSRRSPSGPTTAERRTISKTVEGKIKRASEFEHYQRILVYGRPNAGKTRLASTAPGVLLIDVQEEGTDSVKRDIDPNVIEVTTWDEFIELYWYLATTGHEKHGSYAIDGLSSLQTLCLNYVLGEASQLDASRDPDMPTRQAYGKVGKLMRTWITNYKNLPMDSVWTALTRVDGGPEGEEDELSERLTGPALSPAVQGHALAAAQTVGYLSKKEVTVRDKSTNKRKKITRSYLLVGHSDRYHTKDRNGLFGDVIASPNITKMLETIKEEK